MLGIDRQDCRCRGRRAAHEQGAGTNQTFLIGERHRRAAFGRGERRLETSRTGDRRHDPLGGPLCRLDQSVGAGGSFDAGAGQRGLQFLVSRRLADRGKARAELAREICQRGCIAVCGHRLDAIAPGLALQQIDGAGTDRTGGAEQRHRFRHARQIRSGRWRFLLRLLHLACHTGLPAWPTNLAYHTSKPWAGALGPCRRMPIRSATNAATRKPSRRSISPP